MSDVAARIARAAAIDGHFARLHVVAPRARLDVIAALTGARVATITGLDEARGAAVEAALAGCATRGELVGLVARAEREAADA